MIHSYCKPCERATPSATRQKCNQTVSKVSDKSLTRCISVPSPNGLPHVIYNMLASYVHMLRLLLARNMTSIVELTCTVKKVHIRDF